MAWFRTEDRSHPSNPDADLLRILGGYPSSTGIAVTEESVKRLVAWTACIKNLSEDLSKLPCKLYKRKGRGREEAREHPLFHVLHGVAVPAMHGRRGMTSFQFVEFMQANVCGRGTAYAQKVYNRGGQIVALVPLHCGRMRPDLAGSRHRFVYTQKHGGERTFEADELLIIPGLSDDGVTGITPIAANSDALGSAMAADLFAARWFKAGGHASGVLETDRHLSEESYNRLTKDLEDRGIHGKKTMAGLILEEGLTWRAISISPDDAQALETRKYSVAEIARMFRMPLHKLQELDKATFSNIEQQSLDYVGDTLLPWLVRWEQALALDCLTPREIAEGYFFKFNLTALLRGDSEARSKFYASGRQWGWLSANDIRELEDLNPIEGGDVYLSPINMVPSDQLGGPDNEPTPPRDETDPAEERLAQRRRELRSRRTKVAIRSRRMVEARFLPLFRDAGARVVAREAKDVRRLIARQLSERDSFDFAVELESAYEAVARFAERAIAPVVDSFIGAIADEAFREIIGDESDSSLETVAGPALEELRTSYPNAFAKRHVGTSLAQIRKLVAEHEADKIADALERRLKLWEETRAESIARREAVQSHNSAAKLVWRLLGVLKVRWNIDSEASAVCRHLDGRTVGIEDPFVTQGETIPGEDGADAYRAERAYDKPPLLGLTEPCGCTLSAA